jgi:hypothetical protein
MIFDWTLTLGNLLTVVGFAGAGILFVLFMRSDMLVLSNRVSTLEGAVRELVQVNLAMAEQRGRLQTLDERIDYISTRLDSVVSHMMAHTTNK